MSPATTPVGRAGHVTVTVPAGGIGEVVIAIRGGSEAYSAYAADPGDTLRPGTRVVVIDHLPPRTLIVTPL